MSTLWEVPVATLQERELGTSRRLLRTTSVFEVAPPRDAHRSRVRRERLPEQLRVGGAASRIRAV